MKTTGSIKVIAPTGRMSNLVGKWAIILAEGRPKTAAFICGKASDDYFMVQAISILDGTPNVIRLCSLSAMATWMFYDTADMVADEMAHFYEKGSLRYKFELPQLTPPPP